MALLSSIISEKTGYSEAECKQILLNKMNRENHQYQTSVESKAMEPDSWAAITTCYASSDPRVFIKAIGQKKGPK